MTIKEEEDEGQDASTSDLNNQPVANHPAMEGGRNAHLRRGSFAFPEAVMAAQNVDSAAFALLQHRLMDPSQHEGEATGQQVCRRRRVNNSPRPP